MQKKAQSDNFYEEVVKSSIDAIITINSGGLIQSCNPAGEKMFGYKPEEIVGKNVNVLMPSPYQEEHDGYLQSYLGGGTRKVIGIGREVEGMRKDKSTFPIHLSVSEVNINGEKMFTGIVRDITDVKNIQKKLKESEEKARGILDSAVDSIVTIDSKGTVIEANLATFKAFGYHKEEILGKNINKLMPSPYREEHDSYLARYEITGDKTIIGIGREVTGRRKDGSEFAAYLSVSEYMLDSKKYFTGILRDISDIKMKEDEIRLNGWLQEGQVLLYEATRGETNFTKAMEKTLVGLVNFLDCEVALIYTKNEEKFNFTSGVGHLSAKSRQEYQVGEGFIGKAALEKKQLQLENNDDGELTISSSLIEFKPRMLVAQPIFLEREIIAVIEVASARTLSGDELEFLETMGKNFGTTIQAIRNGEYVRELLNRTQQQQEELRAFNEELEQKTKSLQASEEELKSQQEELKTINEELEEQTQLLEQEKEALAIRTHDLEEAQYEIKRRSDEVEKVSQYKSEFLANMSHELRTPLNSILMLSQSMGENRHENLNEKQLRALSTINSSGTDLLILIEDILDISKVEAGKLEVTPETIDFKQVFEEMTDMFRPMAIDKNVGFLAEVENNFPISIISDSTRLKQVFKNLLSNALKFTEKGEVIIKAFIPEGNEWNFELIKKDCPCFCISIQDTGIGISEDDLPTIFDAFKQLDAKTTRKYNGTGLGLSIVKELVNLLGGELTVCSVMNQGTSFVLCFPTSLAEQHTKTETKSINPGALRQSNNVYKIGSDFKLEDDSNNLIPGDQIILIVEDDEGFAGTLLSLVRESGFKGVVLDNGLKAIKTAESLLPSGILLDMSLPGLDGNEILSLLKENLKTRHIPVQVITGLDCRQEVLKAGAIGYLKKPVDKHHLDKMLGKINKLGIHGKKRLLIVEDNEAQRESLKEYISFPSLEIVEARTAQEGLNILNEVEIDCVVLDLNLPDMPGGKFLKKAKEVKGDELPPVIIYTGKDIDDLELKELEKEAKSVIIKSAYSPERLLDESMLFLHGLQEELSEAKQKIISNLHDSTRILKGKSVLVVDDDPRNVLSLRMVLEDHDVQIHEADNGKVALEQLERIERPDLILMDMMMPEMDGYEATSLIRQNQKFKDIPVIALTAKAMQGEREKCLEAGCDDYLSKPVDNEKLLSLLRVWLYARRSA